MGADMQRREFITLIGGAAAVWPFAARAQQPTMPVIGFLSANRADALPQFTAAFREGLSAAGLVEGKDVAIEYRWADAHLERVPALALDLIRRRVNVIFAGGGDVPILVVKGATATIPIVFTTGSDPVAMGLVASLNRPGGNVTGVTVILSQLGPKRVELLHELLPKAGVVGFLLNPNIPNAEPDTADAQGAARGLGLQTHILRATSDQEIDAAFATLVELKADALLVIPDPSFQSRRDQFVRLAARYAVPTIYYSREYVAAGGLLSYGASFTVMYRQAGNYVGRILGGAKPADLPVMQPTKFELAINLKTAKVLGLTIPPTLLVRADEVIE
jgi:putative tryptophan/tyrosine transport system substrate-binding protein